MSKRRGNFRLEPKERTYTRLNLNIRVWVSKWRNYMRPKELHKGLRNSVVTLLQLLRFRSEVGRAQTRINQNCQEHVQTRLKIEKLTNREATSVGSSIVNSHTSAPIHTMPQKHKTNSTQDLHRSAFFNLCWAQRWTETITRPAKTWTSARHDQGNKTETATTNEQT